MKKLQMQKIVTPAPTRLVIPEGWLLPIPHFTADPEYEGLLAGVLMPNHRHDAHKAREDAKARIDQLARNGWINGAREFVIRCAVDYARRFPMKVRADRTLEGFDPAQVARLYIPHAQARGRDGRLDVRNLLVKMASETTTPEKRPERGLQPR